ncbi:MAG TPA: Hpt domain-containing protein, partial [Opitutaceae bacterium]
MSIPATLLSTIEDTLNRVAAESVLAQPGRDDGLVPAYSLLGDLADQCAGEAAWQTRVNATRAALENKLDTAQPFDAPTLAQLQGLVEWLTQQIGGVRSGKAAAPEAEPVAVAPEVSAPAAEHAGGDVLMDLNLEENRELLVEFFAEAIDHLQQIEAALLALDQEPENPEALNSIFRSFHTIKGNAGFLGLVPMHTLAHEVESLLDLARNRQLTLNAAIITEILRSRDALQALTAQVGVALEKGQLPSEIIPVNHLIAKVKVLAARPTSSAPSEPAAAPAVVAAPAPVPVALPEMQPLAELAPVVPMPGLAPAVEPVAAETATKKNSANAATSAAAAKSSSATVRVNTEKLDSLMDVVGELVIVQSQLVESSRQVAGDNSALQRNVGQLGRITKELQSTAMSLRMIPIKPTFQ